MSSRARQESYKSAWGQGDTKVHEEPMHYTQGQPLWHPPSDWRETALGLPELPNFQGESERTNFVWKSPGFFCLFVCLKQTNTLCGKQIQMSSMNCQFLNLHKVFLWGLHLFPISKTFSLPGCYLSSCPHHLCFNSSSLHEPNPIFPFQEPLNAKDPWLNYG